MPSTPAARADDTSTTVRRFDGAFFNKLPEMVPLRVVAENRDGRTGKVRPAWMERYGKFVSLAHRT